MNKVIFDKQIREAWNHSFSGWDFAYVADRMIGSPLPWDYHKLVLKESRPLIHF